jgi:hypothetical protein
MHFAIKVKNLCGKCTALGLARSKVREKESRGSRGFCRSRDVTQRRAFEIDGDASVTWRCGFRGVRHDGLPLRVDDRHARANSLQQGSDDRRAAGCGPNKRL